MNRAFVPVLFAALAASLPDAAIAQESAVRSSPSRISAHASATRTVRPDLARVTFELSAVGVTPLEAGQRVAERADSIRRALLSLGIPRDSLTTRSQWHWWRGRVEIVQGGSHLVRPAGSSQGMVVQDTSYRVHDAIEARVRDIGKLGAVIDSLLAHGVTQISDIQFTADTEKAQIAALSDATASARRRALAMAEAGGVQLGRIVSLSTRSDGDPGFGMQASLVVRGAGGGGSTQVVEPAVPVTITVYGTWEVTGPQ